MATIEETKYEEMVNQMREAEKIARARHMMIVKISPRRALISSISTIAAGKSSYFHGLVLYGPAPWGECFDWMIEQGKQDIAGNPK